MKPSDKSPTMEKFINGLFNINRSESITNDICVSCGQPALIFRDNLSEKEFSISGLCQECQDKVFKP